MSTLTTSSRRRVCFEQTSGNDDLVEHLVAVREDLARWRGSDEERAEILRLEEFPGGVVEECVAAAVVGSLLLEAVDVVRRPDYPVELAGGLEMFDAVSNGSSLKSPRSRTGVSHFACTGARSFASRSCSYVTESTRTWSRTEGEVLGDRDPKRLRSQPTMPARRPMARDHDQPLARVDDLEHHHATRIVPIADRLFRAAGRE